MTLERIYLVATGLILLGFVLLCQPFSQTLFSAGFPVLVLGVLLHLILDHWSSSTATSKEDS